MVETAREVEGLPGPIIYVRKEEVPVYWDDRVLSLNVYQARVEEIARRTPANSTERRYLNFSLGLAGEAGEVIELIKKVCFHGAVLDVERLAEELGDVLCYLTLLASTAGLSLEGIAAQNLAKLRQRYPAGFPPGR